jgi:hypothetical protein
MLSTSSLTYSLEGLLFDSVRMTPPLALRRLDLVDQGVPQRLR